MTSSSSTSPCAIGDHASTSTRGGCEAARAVLVGEVGVHLDLVHRRHHAGLLDDPVEVGGLEVGDADRGGAPVLDELREGPPGRHEVAVVQRRQRPVDEEQVDPVQAELGQRLVEGATRVVGPVEAVVELAGDVELVAGRCRRTRSPRRRPPRSGTSPRCRCAGSRPRTPWSRSSAVCSGGTWKTPKPSCGMVVWLFRVIVGTVMTCNHLPPGRRTHSRAWGWTARGLPRVRHPAGGVRRDRRRAGTGCCSRCGTRRRSRGGPCPVGEWSCTRRSRRPWFASCARRPGTTWSSAACSASTPVEQRRSLRPRRCEHVRVIFEARGGRRRAHPRGGRHHRRGAVDPAGRGARPAAIGADAEIRRLNREQPPALPALEPVNEIELIRLN